MKNKIVFLSCFFFIFTGFLYSETDDTPFYLLPFLEKYKKLKRLASDGIISGKEAFKIIEAGLDDSDIRINLMSAALLFKYDRDSAVRYIRGLLRKAGNNPAVLNRILSGIERIDDETVLDEVYEYGMKINEPEIALAFAKYLIPRMDNGPRRKKLEEKIFKMFKESPRYLKIEILNLLSEDAEYNPIIEASLTDDDKLISEEAFKIVRKKKNTYFLPVLHRLLKSKNEYVRYNAVISLAVMGDEKYMDLIKKDLTSKDKRVRKSALDFLISHIGEINPDYFVSVINKLALYDKSEVIRKRADDFKRYMVLARR